MGKSALCFVWLSEIHAVTVEWTCRVLDCTHFLGWPRLKGSDSINTSVPQSLALWSITGRASATNMWPPNTCPKQPQLNCESKKARESTSASLANYPINPKPNSRPLASLPCHSLKTSCAVDRRGPAVMNSRTLAINQSLHQSANQSVQQSTYLPMYLHIYLPNYLIYLSIYLSAYPLHLAIYLHN